MAVVMVLLRFVLACVLCAAAVGCTRTETIVPDGLIHPECEANAWMELEVLDIWGRSITQASVTGASDGARTALTANQTLSWDVAVDGFVPTSVTAAWDGGPGADAVLVSATDGAEVAHSLDVLNVEGKGCRVYTVFVGVDHPWYAAGGRPPRSGNNVTLMLDGEEMWAGVYADMARPNPQRVHQSSWWWMSDFELIRGDDHITMTQKDRWKNTMMSLLESRGGPNRVLVARFAEDTAGGMAYLNTDPLLRAHGRDPGDDFEVMLQGNPVQAPLKVPYAIPALPFSFVSRVRHNPQHGWRSFHEPVGHVKGALETLEAASYHQKALMIDHDVAYVGGMNVKSTDWDSNDHRVFDHRRMRFAATTEERLAVKNKQAMSDTGPRKDYGIRVEGPTARDLDDLLRVRWDHGMATSAMFEGDQTTYELLERGAQVGSVTAQLVATMPEPLQERSILETLLKASRNATDLIYIEDQYWRVPILNEVITEAMNEHPDMHMVVITKPVSVADGGKKYTVLGDDHFRTQFPDRYLLLQLKSFARREEPEPEVFFVNMDVHSKIQFVDDVYLCVGSANKNNRGLLYEGELNVAVYDPPMVGSARDRVLINLVGAELADQVIGKSGAEIFATLKTLAEANAAVEAELLADPTADVQPQGFVYPLAIEPGWLLEVGPDVF